MEKFPLVISANILVNATPTISQPSYVDTIYLENTKRKHFCRIFASPFFHGSGRKHFDVFMIENNEDKFHATPEIMFLA